MVERRTRRGRDRSRVAGCELKYARRRETRVSNVTCVVERGSIEAGWDGHWRRTRSLRENASSNVSSSRHNGTSVLAPSPVFLIFEDPVVVVP